MSEEVKKTQHEEFQKEIEGMSYDIYTLYRLHNYMQENNINSVVDVNVFDENNPDADEDEKELWEMNTEAEKDEIREYVDLINSYQFQDNPIENWLESVLEIKYEKSVGHDDTPTEITLVLSTGGPHIELHLAAREIVGYWWGDTVRSSVDHAACDMLWDYVVEIIPQN